MDFNSIDSIGNEEEPGRPLRNHRLRRGVYILPSFFTVANLLCGYYAILATLEGQVADFDNAAKAIGFAILFDALDGRVARAMRTNSEFGRELDSLADVISFGIAPAFLAYAWGVRAMAAGTMKMPVPIIVPTTIAAAAQAPRPFPRSRCLSSLIAPPPGPRGRGRTGSPASPSRM